MFSHVFNCNLEYRGSGLQYQFKFIGNQENISTGFDKQPLIKYFASLLYNLQYFKF